MSSRDPFPQSLMDKLGLHDLYGFGSSSSSKEGFPARVSDWLHLTVILSGKDSDATNSLSA